MSESSNRDEILQEMQKIFNCRGKDALELARKIVAEEELESKEVKEALTYFMNEYWNDVTRPALISLFCEAVGGDPKTAVHVSVPLILISGAVDIHDDLIDQSKIKGSRETVYGKFGKNVALLVGDALLMKGFTELYKAAQNGISEKKISEISNLIKQTFFELGDAEALEFRFRNRVDVAPEDYLPVIRKKSADVEGYARIGAILGGGSDKEINDLGEYGRLLGMLVILRDEMIDMLDPEEVIHRIKHEHLSLVILYALQNCKLRNNIKLSLESTMEYKERCSCLMR